MCNKIYSAIVLVFAIGLALFASFVSIDNIDKVAFTMKFFEDMIPVLAVGALIKYISCGGSKKCGCCGTSCSTCSTSADKK